ncbi:hypothetical protein Hanom_Chr11g00991801 [Helianthus anomalus]
MSNVKQVSRLLRRFKDVSIILGSYSFQQTIVTYKKDVMRVFTHGTQIHYTVRTRGLVRMAAKEVASVESKRN